MNFKNKIKSLQQNLNIEYTKPDPARVEDMVDKLRGSPGWDYLTKERGFTEETINHFSLGYDEKKDAIAIPHFKDGEIINIKYRFLNPKDIRYTSEPNAEQWLFNDAGLEVAKEKGAVAIAEGEFDCISLWQAGFKNVISPGSGANSYGTWIEALDDLRVVYIAYDNDDPGQSAAKELAERIGSEKCKNVLYPEGIKDANDYVKEHTTEQLRELFMSAVPMYSSDFSGLGDVIDSIIKDPMEYIETRLLPGVLLERDTLVVVSGETNAGKSTHSLNMVKDFANQGIPTLFLPIERGVYSLGRRILQILLNKTQEQMQFTSKDEWKSSATELSKLPIYMAKPSLKELEKTIVRAKRLFGVRVAIIDHMDYLIRGASNKEALISEKMHELKHIAEQNGVIIIVISHINRSAVMSGQRPTIKNLKGSSSLEQDSEVAVMLYPCDELTGLEVDIQKNKGPMKKGFFRINVETGVIGEEYDPDDF
jgi:archaellum biogenesis ATPase FlaH/5S rRNA maturation endonuclease (ribonuclease M5)